MRRTLVIPDYINKNIIEPAVVTILKSFKQTGLIESYTRDSEEDSTLYVVDGATEEAVVAFHAFNMTDFCIVRGDV